MTYLVDPRTVSTVHTNVGQPVECGEPYKQLAAIAEGDPVVVNRALVISGAHRFDVPNQLSEEYFFAGNGISLIPYP